MNAELEEGEPRWTPHQVQAAIWTAMKARYEIEDVKTATNQASRAAGLMDIGPDGKERYSTNPEKRRAHLKNWRDQALAVTSENAKAEADRQARDFGDELARMSQIITWEANPSKALGYEINNASKEVLAQFTIESAAILLDENGNDALAKELGIELSTSVSGAGSFEGDVSPNVVTTLIPTREKGAKGFESEAVELYARSVQYIYMQDAVPYFRPENKALSNSDTDAQMFRVVNPETGKTIPKSKVETLEEAQQIAEERGGEVRGGPLARSIAITFANEIKSDRLIELTADLDKYGLSFTRVAPDRIMVINFRDDDTGVPFVSDEDFSNNVADFLEKEGRRYGITGQGSLNAAGKYGTVHDWAEDPGGAGLLVSAGITERPNLQARLDGWREEYQNILRSYSGDALQEKERAAAQRIKQNEELFSTPPLSPDDSARIRKVIDDYDLGENGIDTVGDIVAELADIDDQRVQNAIRQYQNEVQQDADEFGFRGDAETYEETLLKRLEDLARGGDQELFSTAPPVDSQAFRDWFGDSKVVDENGDPLVVYHSGTFDETLDERADGPMHFGTKLAAEIRSGAKIVDDELSQLNVEFDMDEDGYVWSTPSLESLEGESYETEIEAQAAAEDAVTSWAENVEIETSPTMTAVYLSIKNPLRMADMKDNWGPAIEKAIADGHDGIIYSNAFEDKNSLSYIAFSPSQIKSVNNRGTWSRDDDRILFMTPAWHGSDNMQTMIKDEILTDSLGIPVAEMQYSFSPAAPWNNHGPKFVLNEAFSPDVARRI